MNLKSQISLLSRLAIVAALVTLVACPSNLFAQSSPADGHLVSPQNLQQQLQSSSQNRQQNIDAVTGFLSSATADHAIRSAKMDPVQVRNAVPTLSDEELANLAARSKNAQQQFAAGGIGPGPLTLLIIIIAVVIIVVAIEH
jgi:hypothetical protein